MTSGATTQGPCTVLVTLDCAGRGDFEDVLRLARKNLPHFWTAEGFLGGEIFVGIESWRVVMRLAWASPEHYGRCMDDPIWSEIPESVEFQERLAGEAVRMTIEVLAPAG